MAKARDEQAAPEAKLTIRVHPNLADIVSARARRWKERLGREFGDSWQSDYSPGLRRLIAWYVTRSNDDIDRIQREGAEIERKIASVPDLTRGWPVEQEAESVLKPSAGDPPARAVGLPNKGLGGVVHPRARKGQRQSKDDPVVRDHGPIRRG